MTDILEQIAANLGQALTARNWRLAAAESCTGGWIAQTITTIPGSSVWFDCSFVTYSDDAKEDMLGVKAETLAACGAVSEETVGEMALGALLNAGADVAVAVTGIAGPDGGTADKPVGTVWFAWVFRDGEPITRVERFAGDRQAVRQQSVRVALEGLLLMLRH
jgi:nicotinamide-nucleotide amidase